MLYRRQCPELSVLKFSTILKNIESHQQVAVLISSEASWNNWQQLTSQNQVEAEWIYLTLGERLTQLLTHSQALLNQASNIIQLENLSASEIIHHMRCWQGKV